MYKKHFEPFIVTPNQSGKVETDFMEDVRSHLFYKTTDIMMERGEGIYLYDTDNNKYIDTASGTFNMSMGYSHKEILKAVTNQMGDLIHVSSSFQTKPISKLVKNIIDITPKNLTKVHLRVSGGSEANEGAIKIAQFNTGNSGVISTFRSHLGQTMMMMNLSGNAFRKKVFPTVIADSINVPDAYCYRCLYNQKPETCNFLCVEAIYDTLKYGSSGKISCFIIEPISGNGGNIVPPKGYFNALKKLCEEHGIYLIFDEVQTGFGRIGELFAADYYGVKPDIMTMAKGMSGIGLPMAAIAVDGNIKQFASHDHSFTFGNNVLAATAVNKTINIIRTPGFLENVRDVGKYITGRLNTMKENHSFIGDVRGVGLMLGIEIIDSEGGANAELTNKIAHRGMHYGIILRTSRYGYGNVIKIRPSLIIAMEQAEELCDVLEKVFSEFKLE